MITPASAQRSERRLVVGICLLLALAVWVVFGQTLHHEFINYDDDESVYENVTVKRGLTLEGVIWAITSCHARDWHPLTVLSHMLDCQIYGLKPGGHHLTNVLLHAANAVLLFLVFRNMTGRLWPTAFVAAVFAIHPLRVESVAWVTERKDVLSGLFFMLTLWAYANYVSGVRCQVSGVRLDATRDPQPATCRNWQSAIGNWKWYSLALVFFACGLMSKPMLVTLPFVLLLLDYWPLKRLQPSAFSLQPYSLFRRLLLEKLPFLFLTAASCVITIVAVEGSIQEVNVLTRIGNALGAYTVYVEQMFYPVGLAVFYPHPGNQLPVWRIAVSLVVLLLVSAGGVAGWRKRPYLLVGWFWYLGMLLPVIGLLQVGGHAWADRYTYLPQVGLYVLVVWGAVDLCRGSLRHGRLVLNIVAGVILTSLLLISRVQTAYWRDSVSLWTHALACTSGNLLAHYNLGVALAAQGKLEAAGQHYERALQINPDSADVHNNLGWALVQQGKLVEATQHFERALQVEPNHAKAHYNLGNLLVERGKSDEAIEHFERALQLKSNFVAAHVKLGVLMAEQGKLNGAIDHFKQVLRIQPGDAQIRCHLGMAYVRKEQWHEALAQFQKALQIAPGGTLALNNLAWLLATCPEAAVRDGAKAVKLALELDRVSGGKRPTYLDTLAAAYAEAGRFADAVEVAKRAVALAHASAARQLAQEIEARLRLYEKGQPFREAARVDSRPTIGN